MNFEQMESFVCVAKTGSFSQAAKMRYISQPTISNQMKTLEEEMGVQLVTRSSKKIELTEAGAVLFRYAMQMLKTKDECTAEIKKGVTGSKGIVDIIAPGLLTDNQFTEFMIRYAKLHAGGDTICRVFDRDDDKIASLVLEGKADFGVTSVPMEDYRLCCEPLFVEEIILITPNTPEYRDVNKEELKDIMLHDSYIRFDFGNGSDYLWNDNIGKVVGVSLHDIQTAARCSNYRTVLDMVEQNLGIAFISSVVTGKYLREERIRGFRFGKILQKQHYLIYHQNQVERSEILTEIRNMLREEVELSVPIAVELEE